MHTAQRVRMIKFSAYKCICKTPFQMRAFLVVCITLAYGAEWAVQLHAGVSPQTFAAQHRLRYTGAVGNLTGFHTFAETSGSRMRGDATRMDGAKWAGKQEVRQRKTRSDPLFAEQWHLHGTHSVDAEEAWRRGYSGGSRRITVAIVDDGLQHGHPDLSERYTAALSWDFNGNKGDPTPTSSHQGHGTSCGGVCCAQWNNNVCGAGVCPYCSVAGIRLIAAGVTDVTEALALSYHANDVDVYSCSWGPSDDAMRMDGPGYVLESMLEHQSVNGRRGLGSIYTWAAGNGRSNGDQCNYDGYANNRHTLAIGAVDSNGLQSWYSEACSALIAVAPSSGVRGISTVSLDNACTNSFGGTSSAAPLAAGVVALLLEARPDLTWRDVQHVVARGATRIQPACRSWSAANARGFQHSERYGFGLLVLPRLLDTALAHTLVPPQRVLCDTGVLRVSRAFPTDVTMSCTGVSSGSFVEHVDVYVVWHHPCRGRIALTLSNAAGVAQSQLAKHHGDCTSGQTQWRFGSMRHWGEELSRTWTLHGYNTTQGTLLSARLLVHGTTTAK